MTIVKVTASRLQATAAAAAVEMGDRRAYEPKSGGHLFSILPTRVDEGNSKLTLYDPSFCIRFTPNISSRRRFPHHPSLSSLINDTRQLDVSMRLYTALFFRLCVIADGQRRGMTNFIQQKF